MQQNLDMIEAEGASILSMKHGHGSHIKLMLQTPHGQRMLILPENPGDQRAIWNTRARVRRWMKGGPQ